MFSSFSSFFFFEKKEESKGNKVFRCSITFGPCFFILDLMTELREGRSDFDGDSSRQG